MAVKRKSGRKRTKPSASRKKAARSKGRARSKVAKKRASSARRTPKKSRATPKAKPASSAEALARKIVRATVDPSKFKVEDFYAEGCRSCEAAGPPVEGLEGLRRKNQMWEQMQERSTWRARHVLVKGNTIAIEWEAQVKLRGGPTLPFVEVAVHEVKGGKIVSERYYYDPAQLRPPERPPVPERAPPSSPPVNPLDL
jgi:hypothetical protein